MNRKTNTAVVSALLAVSTSASAALVIPTLNAFSSEITFVDRDAISVVNGDGLSDASSATATHDSNPDNGWLTIGSTGATDFDPSITFDLGSVLNVNTLHIWNFNEGALLFTVQTRLRFLLG